MGGNLMPMPDGLRKMLSFTTNEKSDKLGKYKKEKDKYILLCYYLAIFTSILVLFITLFNSRYLHYMPNIFGGLSQASPSPIAKVFNMAVLLGCIVSGFLLYWNFIKYKEYNKQFNSIRLELIASSAENFCKCNNTCDCQERYIKYMRNEGIELIFK